MPPADTTDVDRASKALGRAIIGTLLLGVVKAIAAFLTGSQAVAASAADSLSDAAISFGNRWMVRTAHEPADREHPFGHGKAEALASLAQVVFLSAVVGGVGWRAIGSLQGGPPPLAVPAIVVMVGSMAVSLLLARSLARAAEATGSLILRSDAAHYRMDLWTGGAVLVGLAVTAITGSGLADGIACLVVCAIMAWDIVGIARDAVGELMDQSLPVEEHARVEATLRRFAGINGWHDLRTRRSGPNRFVQVHIELPGSMTLHEAHAIADALEAAFGEAVPGVDALVHIDEGPPEPGTTHHRVAPSGG